MDIFPGREKTKRINLDVSLTGTLYQEKKSIAVEIYHASLFSVYIKFKDPMDVNNGEHFNSLKIDGTDGPIVLGLAQFFLDGNIDGIDGRLVFLNNIYNFDLLFSSSRVLNIGNLHDSLDMFLDHKEKIQDSFKKYVANLAYDMNLYQQYFTEIDELIDNEEEPYQSIIHNTILTTEGRKFMSVFQGYLDELNVIINEFNSEHHKVHGLYFRKMMKDIIDCSAFMKRTISKPLGYAGDYEMMQMIYENGYRGESTFSKILYKISMEHTAAQAVRNRRTMIADFISRRKVEFFKSNNGMFKIMSVACGPAFEIEDLILKEKDVRNMVFTLVDQDEEALTRSSENLKEIEKIIGHKIQKNYIKESVRTIIKTRDLAKAWGTFNYIYSMGLFDYLTQPVAKAVIEKLYQLLDPGGILLIGNFHTSNPSRWFMEYWHDWVLYYREEEDFKAILKETDAADVQVFFEETESQMFLMATKPV